MDLDRACSMLECLDLDTIFSSADINICWNNWKQCFLGIMEVCIPRATLPNSFSPPWLSKEIIQRIRKRNYLYKKANGNRNSTSFVQYKRLRNSVVSALRQAKFNYFNHLDPKSGKTFWRAVRALKRNSSSIPVFTVKSISMESMQLPYGRSIRRWLKMTSGVGVG